MCVETDKHIDKRPQQMNTIKQTFYIVDKVTDLNVGNCKTVQCAKRLAKKHGVSVIYVRHDGALNGAPFLVHKTFTWFGKSITKWSFLAATEEDFANYERDASVDRVDGPDGMRRINWTKEPNTVTVRPSEISEPQANEVNEPQATVHTLATKHVARVAVVDEGDMFDGISDDDICLKAAQITTDRYMRESQALTSPQLTCRLLQAHLGHLQSEQFHALFLDSQHRLIKHQVLSYGTIDGAAVYPREVVKAALKTNCAAVIFAHNHPSGRSDASEADKTITERLVKALASVDIRTLDHMIIGNGEFTSFAEKGWL